MTGPIVVALKTETERPVLQKVLYQWSNLLANPELLQKAVFFNRADYTDIRIPEGKRIWWSGKIRLNFADAGKWKRETEDYAVAIPAGRQRRVGMESCFTEPLLSIALDELAKRSLDFPKLRHIPSEFGVGEDIWWGEDISELWADRRTTETHRAIGRAFGYREDRISEAYPDTWLNRCRKLWRK
ncbi:MAG: hypothetical protein ABSG79_11880 [Bryobacteraceae bacterium]|jgi:hypothetical protein